MKSKLHVWACAATLSLAFVASSFGDIRAVTPTAWNGDPNCWQMKRHNEKMSLVANGGAKVVFIGDSITHFWETHGKAQWAKYFADGPRKALDLGTSAENISALPSDFRKQLVINAAEYRQTAGTGNGIAAKG